MGPRKLFLPFEVSKQLFDWITLIFSDRSNLTAYYLILIIINIVNKLGKKMGKSIRSLKMHLSFKRYKL